VSWYDNNNPTLLRVEHLGRVVSGKVLVEDVTFDVVRGEIVALVGPSGSGKTSLLRLLNRLDEPSSGTIYAGGVDYRSIAPRELRRRLGMVTQRAYLFPGTVEENLQFGPRQRGETLSPEIIAALLIRVGLKDYASRNVANLSGGEAQRVSLARTLANSPLILLLDEPTSALDGASKHGIELLIREIIQDEGLTCLLVTHDIAQAARICQRALLLEAGRVLRDGPVHEVLNV
jgi:putative ABC transport system ATP-binding protein